MSESESSEPASKRSRDTINSPDTVMVVNVEEAKKKLCELYDMQFPDDFYKFWTFCVGKNSEHPGKFLKNFDLRLGGPFAALLGKKGKDKTDYWLHDRYFFDIPEFQTVLVGDDVTKFHIGYMRDNPNEMPSLLLSNEAAKHCEFKILGDNIFSALISFLERSHKNSSKKLCNELRVVIKHQGYEEGKRTAKVKARDKKVVSKGFHAAGIVVPMENDIGWREVPRSIGELKKIFKGTVDEIDKDADELQELITYVQFANDECDYGQGLELGQDLFCYGDEKLHRDIKHLLPLAYTFLGYTVYKELIEAHLKDRKKDNLTYLH